MSQLSQVSPIQQMPQMPQAQQMNQQLTAQQYQQLMSQMQQQQSGDSQDQTGMQDMQIPSENGSIEQTRGIVDLADSINKKLEGEDQPPTEQKVQIIQKPQVAPKKAKANEESYFDLFKKLLQEPVIIAVLVIIMHQSFMLQIFARNFSWFIIPKTKDISSLGLAFVGIVIGIGFAVIKYLINRNA